MADADDLRRLALALEGTHEAPHFDRAAFKVARIYATLAADGRSVNLKFRPDEQELKCLLAPEVFSAIPNAWGRQGWTTMHLASATLADVQGALEMAWRHALPKQKPRARPAPAGAPAAAQPSAAAGEALERAFGLMRAAARELDLPGLAEGTGFGRPQLAVGGKWLVGSKDGRSLVLYCPEPEKELLLEAAPEIYFQTPHYEGYPAILARPEMLDVREMKARIQSAWRARAPRRLVAAFEARGKPPQEVRRSPGRRRSPA
jgi:hypothetical protein